MTETPDPTPRCIVCHHPHAWRGWVCDPCVARVDRQLGDMLDLHTLAQTTAALTRPTTGQTSSASIGRAAPIPCHLAALDLAHGEWLLRESVNEHDERIWEGLESWERNWRHHFDLTPYGQASAARMALERPRRPLGDTEAANTYADTNRTLCGVIAFLRAWWPRVADDHPAADEFANDVRRMHGAARAALNLGEDRPWTVPCPADLGDRECGYRLHVNHVGRELLLHCPRCNSDWTVARLLLVAAAAGRGVWVSAAEAAEHVGVHRATVHRAVASGLVASRYGRVDLVSVRNWRERLRSRMSPR